MKITFKLRHLGGTPLLRRLVGRTLDDIQPAAQALARGSTDGDDIHRLRVALRRLRTLLRELAALSGAVDPQWEPALAVAFRQLGQWRDRQQVLSGLLPRLHDAGGPLVTLPDRASADVPPPGDIVAAAGFAAALEAIGAFAAAQSDEGEKEEDLSPKSASAVVRKRLDRLHRKLRRAADGFEALPADAQHQVRKQLKRLRYLAEFTAPLFDRDAARRYIRRLKPAQDALGLQNDEAVALDALRDLVHAQPQAWYGVGWLTARQPARAAAARKALERALASERFWR